MAQVDSLSTTFNGARAFFVTTLQQAGRNQPPHGKAFWAHTSGVYPQLIRRPDISYPDLREIRVSEDASVMAVTAQSCSESTCPESLFQSTVFLRRGQPQRYDGTVLLSPNGDWALRLLQPASASVRVSTIHLGSRRERMLYDGPGAYCPECQSISDDGTAAINVQGLQVFGPRGMRFSRTGNVLRAAISADAQVVAWQTEQGIFALRAPFTGEPERLSGGDSRLVSLERDGSSALFLWSPDGELYQGYIAQTDGSALRQVTFDPLGIRSAALSGNGRILWVFANDRKLWKVELQPRSAELITTFPPTIAPVTLAIGSAARINASVVPREPVRILINGMEPPNIAVESGALMFQVPWELQPGAAQVELLSDTGFPWRAAPTAARLQALLPAIAMSRSIPLIAHEDWSSLVTPASRARTGEIIHLYATGLGPVVPAPRTGEPWGAGALVQPLTCEYSAGRSSETALPLLYAGPAPGTVGYYQLSFRVPADLESFENNVRCRQGDEVLRISLPVEP
jgi:uncharacterized protein (TIGR03437 family)